MLSHNSLPSGKLLTSHMSSRGTKACGGQSRANVFAELWDHFQSWWVVC